MARPQIFAFDTENAVINVTGTASMASEQLDLTIDPESKGIRIITLRSPLYVRGTFKDPQAGVKAGPLIARGAVAAALATLVTCGGAAGVDFAVRRRSESVSDDFVADEEVVPFLPLLWGEGSPQNNACTDGPSPLRERAGVRGTYGSGGHSVHFMFLATLSRHDR